MTTVQIQGAVRDTLGDDMTESPIEGILAGKRRLDIVMWSAARHNRAVRAVFNPANTCHTSAKSKPSLVLAVYFGATP